MPLYFSQNKAILKNIKVYMVNLVILTNLRFNLNLFLPPNYDLFNSKHVTNIKPVEIQLSSETNEFILPYLNKLTNLFSSGREQINLI